MSRRESIKSARRGSVFVDVGGSERKSSLNEDDSLDKEAIVQTLISKEQRRRNERAALIAELRKDEEDQKNENDEHKIEDKIEKKENIKCPYLDTIHRAILDFDFEKLCSVSLSHNNVYCCLICSKYFQGRGKGTHAYLHALDCKHYVYLNLHNAKFYCLPDNYEIVDPSLDDILYQLNPMFTEEDLKELHYYEEIDEKMPQKLATDGSKYWTGLIGMNNIKHNDYINVVIQGLAQVPKFRDHFLVRTFAGNKQTSDRIMLRRLGELLRKLWKNHHYRPHVSPHEFLQSVVIESKGRFQFTERGNAGEFLTWFLNSLDKVMRKYEKNKESSFIRNIFEGEIEVTSRRIPNPELSEEEKRKLLQLPKYKFEGVSERQKFMFLLLDLPPKPLFVDPHKQIPIPQVHINTLLEKFNGQQEKEYKLKGEDRRDPLLKRFRVVRLPDVLIFQIQRFTKNNFFVEKNPTIVQYPVSSLDMGPYCLEDDGQEIFDLVANIVHDGEPKDGSYRIHVNHKLTNMWKEIQDLVVSDALPEMIPLSEAFIQIWVRRPKVKGQKRKMEVDLLGPPPPPPPSANPAKATEPKSVKRKY